jgi:hypothetical protein
MKGNVIACRKRERHRPAVPCGCGSDWWNTVDVRMTPVKREGKTPSTIRGQEGEIGTDDTAKT